MWHLWNFQRQNNSGRLICPSLKEILSHMNQLVPLEWEVVLDMGWTIIELETFLTLTWPKALAGMPMEEEHLKGGK